MALPMIRCFLRPKKLRFENRICIRLPFGAGETSKQEILKSEALIAEKYLPLFAVYKNLASRASTMVIVLPAPVL